MPKGRSVKIAEQIKVIVAEMLERRIKDPRLGFVTITDVRVTGDNREATIFYTVMGTPESFADTAAALEASTGLIRSTVGKQLGMKFTPTIRFVLDAVPESAAQMDELLARVRAGDAAIAAQAAGAAFAGEADPYKKKNEDDDLD